MRIREYTDPRRGAILMICVVFALVISVSLGTFLRLAINEMRLSDRAFHANSCINLAEAGIEDALYALNRENWTGWQTDNGDRVRRISNIALGRNSFGEIRVRVRNPDTPNPTVLAQGSAEYIHGEFSKQLEIRLRQRSPFANGLTARDWVRFAGGNAYVDSYRSDVGYDPDNHLDNGSVGSVSVEPDAVDVGNANIWGFVSTGAQMPDLGPNGRIRGFDTPAGVNVDFNRVATDFSSSFEEVEAPFTFGLGIHPSGGTIGDPTGTLPIDYKVTSIGLAGNQELRVVGPVRIIVEQGVSVRGNARIVVEDGGSVEFYVEGDFDIGGNGMVNETQRPRHLLIYGTNSTPGEQTIKLAGNAVLYSAVYAPNASVELVGGGGGSGRLFGAAVGNDIFMNGTFRFHYDETLAEDISDDSYSLDLWREIAPADRVAL